MAVAHWTGVLMRDWNRMMDLAVVYALVVGLGGGWYISYGMGLHWLTYHIMSRCKSIIVPNRCILMIIMLKLLMFGLGVLLHRLT